MAPGNLRISSADAPLISPLFSATAHMATTTLKVGGMTCGACTSAVESGFKGVNGVGNVSISLVMERAVIMHDPHTISAEQVREIIEDRGFDAEVLTTDLLSPVFARNEHVFDYDEDAQDADSVGPNITTTTLAVQGMTCGACTSAIEGGFTGVAGVKHFNVSLLAERAVVEHDATILTAQQILEIIEDRGFDAQIIDSQLVKPESKKSRKSTSMVQSQVATTTVAIEGMTCGACTSAVEGGFVDVEGLIQFSISLLAERAVIVHDLEKLAPSRIKEIIEDRGFEAVILSTNLTDDVSSGSSSMIQFKLFGVQDANSANELEALMRGMPGVAQASLSLASQRLAITYTPKIVGLRALVEMIESQGYNALVADNDDNNAQLESLAKTKEITEWKRAFRISLSFAIPVFFISMIFPMFLPFLDFSGIIILFPGLYLGDLVCLFLTIPVQFGIGKRFYISAYKSLKHGSPTMDVLVVLGTSAAFFFSVATMIVSVLLAPHTRPSTIFDTSTMLITFITLGRFLENRAKGQTSKALSRLMSLAPSMATIYVDPIAAEKAAEGWNSAFEKDDKHTQDGNAMEERIIPTELIQVGDIVILRPGDKIPADGTVTNGESYVDESMVTGEAEQIKKRKGSLLIGGTVNGAGRLDFRVTRAGRDTQLSQIVKLVQDAQTSRAPIQRLADRIAGVFVPVILFLGISTFVGWMILSHVLSHPPKIFDDTASGGKLLVCVKLCISVIVFACPCALGLATPTAVMVGTGRGAESGILVKGGAALETATKITYVVLDKTGTITMGKMSVSETRLVPDWQNAEWRRRLWWTVIGLSESGSEHPIGKAVLLAAKEELQVGPEGTIDGTIGEFSAVVGKGISALVEPTDSAGRKRYRVLIGSVRFLRDNQIDVPESAIAASETRNQSAAKSAKSASSGTSNIFTAIDGSYTGHLCLSDTVKPSARAAIIALNRMNVQTAIVTGDQLSTALAVARVVGIPAENVHAGISPDQKQAIVKRLQARGECVAMVGDGINDSPALATANVGIAMASGTDVAMEAADIVLMRSTELMDIPASIHLARTIFARIKLNLLWACGYNIVGLPFAMGIFLPFGWHLHPMAAGAAMAFSSVSVVGSSLLLKFWRRPRWMEVLAVEEGGAGGGKVLRRKGKGWGFVGGVESFVKGLWRRSARDEGYRPLDAELV